MIMKHITKILALAIVLLMCTGCFKEEKQGTRMRIALYSQNVEQDPILKTTSDIEGYAFWVEKGSTWEIKSWEDALERRITNVKKPSEVLTRPDVEATYDVDAEYQLTFELWSTYAFMVVVDKTNRIYATRLYETPMNLPTVTTQLHLYAWRKSGKANGWDVANPFPDEAREPLVPIEEEEENTEESTDEESSEEDTTEDSDDKGDENPSDEPQDNTTEEGEATEDESEDNSVAEDDTTAEEGEHKEDSTTEEEDKNNEDTEDKPVDDTKDTAKE